MSPREGIRRGVPKGNHSLRLGLQVLADQADTEGEGIPYVIFNGLGWSRDAVISIEGEQGLAPYDSDGALAQYDAQTEENGKTSHRLNVHVQGIPALGYKTIWLKRPAGNQAVAENSTTVFADSWETDHYKVSFNERGEITSLWDKEAHREVVKPGEAANRFHFFHDRPTLWDAWDIDTRYEEQLAGEAELIEKKLVHAGEVQDVPRFHWRIHNSEIMQDMIFIITTGGSISRRLSVGMNHINC